MHGAAISEAHLPLTGLHKPEGSAPPPTHTHLPSTSFIVPKDDYSFFNRLFVVTSVCFTINETPQAGNCGN